jgi:hypothetical protein
MVGLPEEFRAWVNSLKGDYTKLADREFDVTAIVINKHGQVYYFNCGNGFTGPLRGEFFTVGSGDREALAACHMGATAEKAVEIAALCDYATGLPVETLAL